MKRKYVQIHLELNEEGSSPEASTLIANLLKDRMVTFFKEHPDYDSFVKAKNISVTGYDYYEEIK